MNNDNINNGNTINNNATNNKISSDHNLTNEPSHKRSPTDLANAQAAKSHTVSDTLDTNTIATQAHTSHINNVSGQGGRLELLEERPVVNKERLDVGQVTITKHTRTKTINVPIELIEEYITVETQYSDDDSKALLVGNYDDKDIVKHVNPTLDNHAVVTINGNQVQIGDAPIEIVISRQVAVITKDTHVIQDVEISKTTHVHTDTIPVMLQHEELEVFEEGFLDHKGARQLKK